MAERPEVAIQAILAGIWDMQQLNMQLADRLALAGPGGQGPAVKWDHLGRTRSEARNLKECAPGVEPLPDSPPLSTFCAAGSGTTGTTSGG